MTSKKQQLFKEFNKVSEQEWIAKIEKDLKGKPLSILNYQPELGIETKAYFHSDHAKNYQPIKNRGNNNWYVQERFEAENNKQLNQTILNHLLRGCDGIQLVVDSNSKLNEVLKDIGLQYISTEFVLESKDGIKEIKNILKPEYSNISIAFDVLTLGVNQGKFKYHLNDFVEFYLMFKPDKVKHIHIDGYTYGLAGASSIQELAIALSQLSEYTQTLLNTGESLSDIIASTYTTLSINDEYFTNIAKFRAYKILLNHFFKSFDNKIEIKKSLINAIANKRHIAKNDRYNNLLRATTQAMSAILGGATNILIPPFDASNDISVRMARNIQLVLKEESYFDKVIDPAAGAYYIEDLTDKLVQSAWDLFLDIEHYGGYVKSIKDNFIQSKVNNNKKLLIENLNTNKKTFLGVNKYPSTLENWIDVKPQLIKGKEFEPLTEFILEQYFQKPTEQ
jgi:methylmalonyl-CoA mutase